MLFELVFILLINYINCNLNEVLSEKDVEDVERIFFDSMNPELGAKVKAMMEEHESGEDEVEFMKKHLNESEIQEMLDAVQKSMDPLIMPMLKQVQQKNEEYNKENNLIKEEL